MAKENVDKQVQNEKIGFFRDIVFPTLFTLLIVTSILFSSTVLFQKRYFGRFFVNGQSMYPTLNRYAKDPNGKEYGEKYEPLRTGSHDIDYGIYDRHDHVMKDIKRFDIVICKYLAGDSTDKIKRLIVMPGETFYLTRTSVGDEGNGLLYIKNEETSDFELVEQPIDSYFIHAGEYPEEYSTPYTLKDNEYFVMGDNRGGSNDSRLNGPVTKNLIEGKVIALVAKCSVAFSVDSRELYPDEISYYWPRYF